MFETKTKRRVYRSWEKNNKLNRQFGLPGLRKILICYLLCFILLVFNVNVASVKEPRASTVGEHNGDANATAFWRKKWRM